MEIRGIPLAFVSYMLHEKKLGEKDATEQQLHKLKGIDRLLLRVEAVHAVSWLWSVGIPSTIGTTGEGQIVSTSTPLMTTLTILRRRTRRSRVLLAALFRWVDVMKCMRDIYLLVRVWRSCSCFGATSLVREGCHFRWEIQLLHIHVTTRCLRCSLLCFVEGIVSVRC